MKKCTSLLFALATLLLMACKSDPTGIAKNIVAQTITTQSNGALKLKDFTKMNATSEQVFGVELYVVEYTVTVEAVAAGGWVFLDNEATPKLWGYTVLNEYKKDYTNYQLKAGEVLTVWSNGGNMKITLKKTENGWIENAP